MSSLKSLVAHLLLICHRIFVFGRKVIMAIRHLSNMSVQSIVHIRSENSNAVCGRLRFGSSSDVFRFLDKRTRKFTGVRSATAHETMQSTRLLRPIQRTFCTDSFIMNN